MVGEAVALDLCGVDDLTGPADDAGDQPRLAAGLGGREQLLELRVLEVIDAVEIRVFLLQVARNDERGLPVLTEALAERDDLAVGLCLVPGLVLVRQPDLHGDVRVAVAQTLEQGQRGSQHHVGRIVVAYLDDVLGDAVLDLCAGPVQVAEDKVSLPLPSSSPQAAATAKTSMATIVRANILYLVSKFQLPSVAIVAKDSRA